MNKKNIFLSMSLVLIAFAPSSHADWFTSAETKELITKADAGDMEAQFRVGNIYDTGNVAPSSSEKAKKYYQMAAEQGYAEAQNSLGSMLQAEKNYAEAKSWYELAMAQNHSMATNSLGYLYDIGLGIPQDRNKGFELYSRAANLGWSEAMWNLANMHGAGQVGKPDLFMACVWAVRAQKYAEHQNPLLIKLTQRALPAVKNNLSGKDWAQCQQDANSWAPELVKQ